MAANPITIVPTSETGLPKYSKRFLPDSLASWTPNGPIYAYNRSPEDQDAIEKRKLEFLQTMTAEQIDTAYVDLARKITNKLEAGEKRNREIDTELATLKADHEIEMRVLQADLQKKEEESKGDEMDED